MKKNILKIKFYLLAMLFLAFYSCNPNLDDEILVTENEIQDEFLVKLSNANIKAQEVLLDLLQAEPELRKEILKTGVKDDGIEFKTLFDPTTESFQRLSPALLGFKDKFSSYYSGNESNAQRTSQQNTEALDELIQTLTDGNTGIYMPYIEAEMLEFDHITVVATTLDNQGDSGEGYRINLNSDNHRGNSQTEDPPQLIEHVDDDYADNNPTLILQPIDGGGSTGGGSTGGGSTGGGSTGGGSTGTIEIYDSLYRMHVQIADMKCTKQYDPLLGFNTNGGGSEFKFFRAKPEYNFTEEEVNPASHEVQAELSRREIRKEWWVSQFVNWDYQWEAGEEIQGFAIYEWDNTDNEVKINGTVKLNLDKKAKFEDIEIARKGEVSAGFSATLKSKNTVLEDQDINREYFYDDIKKKKDFGHGFHRERSIRKAGSLYYTINTFNYYNE